MEHKNDQKIAGALKVLEDAARQKRDELKSVMADKYKNLRGLIVENDSTLLKSFAAAKGHAIEATTHVKEAGVEKAREIARDAEQGLHRNPWPYIAGSAIVGVLLGHMLSRNPK